MPRPHRSAALATAFLLPLVALAACDRRDTLDDMRERRIVRVGFAIEPPYALRTADGRVSGEGPEVARAVFAGLGVDSIEWVQTEFAALIPELRIGRFDVIASSLYDLPERRAVVRFTHPTLCPSQGLIIRRGAVPVRDGGVQVADLVAARVRIAVVRTAYEHSRLLAAGIPDARLFVAPDVRIAAAAITSGSTDAMAMTYPALRALYDSLSNRERFELHPMIDADTARRTAPCSAIAVRQSDARLADAMNQQLARYLGTAAHLQVIRPLGFGRGDLPAPVPGGRR